MINRRRRLIGNVRPSEMKLTTQQDCDLANTRFNAFHDGFLRELRWQSPMRFAASMPWEPKKLFKTNEERLLATGTTPIADELLSLFICHYNYDWPNQPNTRVIEIRFAGKIKIRHQIDSDRIICGLVFAKTDDVISCNVRWETFGPPNNEPLRDSEFQAELVTIAETEIAD